jgi:hypothetical protein
LADEYEVAPKEFSGREANVADGADVRRASNWKKIGVVVFKMVQRADNVGRVVITLLTSLDFVEEFGCLLTRLFLDVAE